MYQNTGKYKGKNYSSDWIEELNGNEIFVFGSNLSGIHGAGAAKIALNKFGAIFGQGVGIQGKSYAIPTKDVDVATPLDLNTIELHVIDFVLYAAEHLDQKFLVTEIGCGLAGFEVSEIAPLFEDAIDLPNVYLPKRFIDVLKDEE